MPVVSNGHVAQMRRNRFIGQRVQEPCVQRAQLLHVESCRRARHFPEGEADHELMQARMRGDGIGGADRGGVTRHCQWLESFLAQTPDGQRPLALRQSLALGADQEIVMAEGGGLGTKRLEQLNLRCRVGDVILAAHHMGDAEVDIVDDARQRVEIGTIGADQHRVRQRGCIHMLLAADEIVPHHIARLELETPMGSLSRRLQFLAVGVGELQRGAVVDRRLTAGELALPLQLELVLRLEGRIEPSARLQLLDGCVIDREAV
jgi:hypothetical protein